MSSRRRGCIKRKPRRCCRTDEMNRGASPWVWAAAGDVYELRGCGRGQPIAISASENRILTMGSVDRMVRGIATSCVESKRCGGVRAGETHSLLGTLAKLVVVIRSARNRRELVIGNACCWRAQRFWMCGAGVLCARVLRTSRPRHESWKEHAVTTSLPPRTATWTRPTRRHWPSLSRSAMPTAASRSHRGNQVALNLQFIASTTSHE